MAARKWPGNGRKRAIGSPGITLIELLVVLAIITLVAVIAVPTVMNRFAKAKHDTASIQVERLGTILDMYRLDVGTYPTTADGLEALVSQPPGIDRWTGPYLQKRASLTDPWGQPYSYRSPGDNGPYDLWSTGADETEGGEGNDADIRNW